LANFNNDIMDTTKVGSYPDVKSPYGVLDMAGNVEEWVEDWFGPTYYVHSILDNPLGPSDGSFRVLRGGNWLQSWFYLRTAYRNSFIPDGSSYDVGFRCAQSIP
jgi:formylglycine-generating enzyme required for sulfatase activity